MEKDMSFFVPTDFAWIMEILSKHGEHQFTNPLKIVNPMAATR